MLQGLPVPEPHLTCQPSAQLDRRMLCHPVRLLALYMQRIQPRRILALLNQQHIALQVLAHDEPPPPVARAAYAQPPALAQRVVHKPVVPAHDMAIGRNHVARLCGQILHQKPLEVALAYEAYAGRVLLGADRQPVLRRQPSQFGLGHAAYREHRHAQRALAQHVQEVSLILVLVGAALQPIFAIIAAHPGIVTGRQFVRAQLPRKVQQCAELYLAVAQHVRVGRATAPVLVQEVAEHPLLILPGKVDRVVRYAYHLGDALHVAPVLRGGAYAVLVLLLPVVHEYAYHVVALPLEQQRRHRRVHAARHAHYYSHVTHQTARSTGTARRYRAVSQLPPVRRTRPARPVAAPPPAPRPTICRTARPRAAPPGAQSPWRRP